MSFNFIAGFAGQDDPDISRSFILPSCRIGRNTQIVASPRCWGCMGLPVSAQENLNCQQTSEELGEWSRDKINCSLKCLGWWLQTNGWFATCFETPTRDNMTTMMTPMARIRVRRVRGTGRASGWKGFGRPTWWKEGPWRRGAWIGTWITIAIHSPPQRSWIHWKSANGWWQWMTCDMCFFIWHLKGVSLFPSSDLKAVLAPGQLQSQLLSPALLWESALHTAPMARSKQNGMWDVSVSARFAMADLWLAVRSNWSELLLPLLRWIARIPHPLQHVVFAGLRVLNKHFNHHPTRQNAQFFHHVTPIHFKPWQQRPQSESLMLGAKWPLTT